MKFASYEYRDHNGVGEVVGDTLLPLEGVTEIGLATTSATLASGRRLASIPLSSVRIRPVVPAPSKIFCVGLNFRAHVEETGRELPTYPVLFPKWASSLIGAGDDIVLPPESSQVDYEGELAVIIGTPGRRIAEKDASNHILGFAVANDVTMRDYQYKTHQWLQGKAWDRSTPVGPYLVTPDEVAIESSGIRTHLNGEKVQDSNLSYLIFSIPNLIATLSEFTELQPGDIILTGTPSGVGYRRDPQVFLADGDTVTVEIDGVGTLTSRVRAER